MRHSITIASIVFLLCHSSVDWASAQSIDQKIKRPAPVKTELVPKKRTQIFVERCLVVSVKSKNFMQIDCRIKNLTGRPIEYVNAKILLRDKNKKLISSFPLIVTRVAKGVTKTETTGGHPYTEFDHLDVEFEGEMQFGKRVKLEVSKPAKVVYETYPMETKAK